MRTLFPEMWRRRPGRARALPPRAPQPLGPGAGARVGARGAGRARAHRGQPVGGQRRGLVARGRPALPRLPLLHAAVQRGGLADCAAHALHVQAAPLRAAGAGEPRRARTPRRMHVLDFMARLHARTGLPLLFDLGHLFSHQLSAGLPLEAGLDGFPLDQVIEIHLAGGVVTRAAGRASSTWTTTPSPCARSCSNCWSAAAALSLAARRHLRGRRAPARGGQGHRCAGCASWFPRVAPAAACARLVTIPCRPSGESRPWELFDVGHGVTPRLPWRTKKGRWRTGLPARGGGGGAGP